MLRLDHRILENPTALRLAGLVPEGFSRSERAVAPSAQELSGSRGATSSTSPHRQTAKTQEVRQEGARGSAVATESVTLG